MNIELLAFYLGYAFCQATYVQTVLEPDALMVPFVVHWEGEKANAIPYPANSQAEAVEKMINARNNQPASSSGWSSGRDGLITLREGIKHDVLYIEASVPELSSPVAMFYLYKTKPFTLVENFNFQNHPEVRQSMEENEQFMTNFKHGIESHAQRGTCFKLINNSSKL